MIPTVLRMAWRNIWRNKRRTLITCSAIGLSLAMMIFYRGMQGGMSAYMVHSATRSYMGHAQIHATGFRETREAERVIPDAQARLEQARALAGVEAAAPRVLATGLLALGDRAAGVELIGVDLEHEPRVTDWEDRLIEGRYLGGPDDLLIGRKLAETMELEAGSKVVLTLAEEGTGELRSLLLEVAGTYFTGNQMLDEHMAILSGAPLREAMGMPAAVHEIVLNLDAPTLEVEALNALLAPLQAPELEVEPWQELMPAVASIIDMQAFYLAITVTVVFAVIALGIVNTLAMSLSERIWEFGVLRALGTTPGKLAGLILAEAASLGVVGAILGTGIGVAAHAWFSDRGLSLGDFQFAGYVFESRIYSFVDAEAVLILAVVFVLLTTLVGLSTALRAARIRPADALRQY